MDLIIYASFRCYSVFFLFVTVLPSLVIIYFQTEFVVFRSPYNISNIFLWIIYMVGSGLLTALLARAYEIATHPNSPLEVFPGFTVISA